jgi:ATP-dependent Clp protease protease subunit
MNPNDAIRFDGDDEKNQESGNGSDALMNKMMKTRSILLSGEVNKELAERVVRSLLILEAMGDEPIKFLSTAPAAMSMRVSPFSI